jgi:prevent-host-death family protein
MKTLLVSEFKAHCVGVLNEVADFREEVMITKRGKPLARIVPIDPPARGDRVPGDYATKGAIHSDLLAEDSGDWEALEG